MPDANRDQDFWHQWRDWTVREEQCILSEDWAQLARCHEAKKRLQSTIAEGDLSESHDDSMRAMGRELIKQERQNLALLQATRQRLQSQHDLFESGLRNLRRLRGSYSAGRQSCWHSYS